MCLIRTVPAIFHISSTRFVHYTSILREEESMFLRQKRKKQVTATYPIPIITIHLKPIFLIILLMLTLLGTRQQYVLAQEIIEENIRDDAIVCPLTSALSSTATAHVGTSPFAPPEGTDTTFVVDDAPGLDTGCTFRNGGPLVFNIQVTRNFGDEDKLQAAKECGFNNILNANCRRKSNIVPLR